MLMVDRIEGCIAVCEQDGVLMELPLAQINGTVKEGDALLPMEDGRFTVDSAATQQRRTRLAARFESLRKKK